MAGTSFVKRGVKRLLRPVGKPFYFRVDREIDLKLKPLSTAVEHQLPVRQQQLEAKVDSLARDIEALSRHLPAVINNIATQNANNRLLERRLRAAEDRATAAEESIVQISADLQRRLEFIRKEILFEQRYGPGFEPGGVPEPRICNPDKLREMAGNVRLNLGAGHIPLDGYLNVDSRALPGIDITADIRRLPFDPGSVREIYSAHMLEHFPEEELRRSILPYWVSLLADGGKFVAVVPDLETMVQERSAGRMPFEDFREVVYGGQEYEGDFHFNGFSEESLTALLEEAGLTEVKVVESGRRNGACYEMEIEAVRRALGPG